MLPRKVRKINKKCCLKFVTPTELPTQVRSCKGDNPALSANKIAHCCVNNLLIMLSVTNT